MKTQRHFYACAWWYGVATWQCSDGSTIPGRTVRRFDSKLERDEWVDDSYVARSQSGYREALLRDEILAHEMRAIPYQEAEEDGAVFFDSALFFTDRDGA